jgi:hypothetical protein
VPRGSGPRGHEVERSRHHQPRVEVGDRQPPLSSAPGIATEVFCSARDAAGVTARCSSQAPELVDAARAIGPDAYVELFWDTSSPVGKCTGLNVVLYSSNEPKK